jgi:hypothetical protein
VVTRREFAERSSEVLSRHRSRKAAYTAAQHARIDCDAEQVIQVAGWAMGGWWVEVLPARRRTAVPDDTDLSIEAVYSPEGVMVGAIDPQPWGRGWRIRTSTDGKTFRIARAMTDALVKTQAQAVATVHRLAEDDLNDPTWPSRWEQARTTLAHTTRGQVRVGIEFLGAAGVRCTYPHCTTEAVHKLTLEGSDTAGETPRMSCQHHTAVIMATVTNGPPPPGP